MSNDPINLKDLVDIHEQARAEIAELKKALNAKLAPLEQIVQDTTTLMLEVLDTMGSDSAKVSTPTQMINVSKELDEKYSIKDRAAFNRWVVENDAAEVFQARINVAAMIEVAEDALPPGVQVFREYTVAIRRTTKKQA